MQVEGTSQGNGAAEGSSSTEGSSTSAAPAGATSGAETSDATAAAPAPDVSGGVGTPPAYQPNFKFKYSAVKDGKDEQVEAELDELFKPLVKDADTEKKIRELHEKAYGIDFVKADRARIKETHAAVASELTGLKDSLGQLAGFVRQNDYDSFFQALGIPEKAVMEYALKKAQFAKLPPEQQQAHFAQQAERRRLQELEQQNQHLQQQYQQVAVQTRTQELDMVLARPDYAQAAEAFDRAVGRPGAFRAEVIQRGQYHAAVNQRDLPADAVAQEVLGMIRPFMQSAPASQPVSSGAPVVAPAREAKPTLPNIAGKGTSPTRKVVSSLADIKQRAKDLAAQENG